MGKYFEKYSNNLQVSQPSGNKIIGTLGKVKNNTKSMVFDMHQANEDYKASKVGKFFNNTMHGTEHMINHPMGSVSAGSEAVGTAYMYGRNKVTGGAPLAPVIKEKAGNIISGAKNVVQDVKNVTKNKVQGLMPKALAGASKYLKFIK